MRVLHCVRVLDIGMLKIIVGANSIQALTELAFLLGSRELGYWAAGEQKLGRMCQGKGEWGQDSLGTVKEATIP